MLKRTQFGMLKIMLVASLLIALLSACAENNQAAQPSVSPSSGNSPEQSAAPSKPVELTVFSFMFGKEPPADSLITKALQDKLNITLKWTSAPYDTYKDKLNVLIASGQIPDIFFHEGVDMRDIYHKWIQQGLLLPISDYASSYPNVERHLQRFELLKKGELGKNYSVPAINHNKDITTANQHAFYIRKDWLTNLGLSMPTTIEEFRAVVEAFAKGDPDQNGKPDTYGITAAGPGLGGFYILVNAFNASADRFRLIDGKWTPEIITDDGKQALQFLNQLYKDKIIDPEFMVNNGQQAYQKFVSGKAGILLDNATPDFYNGHYDRFQQAYPDKDPKTMFDVIPVLVGINGSKRVDGFNNFWGGASVSASVSEEKRDAAFRLFDYLLSDEGSELMQWGIEGVHYSKDGDKYTSLITEKNENGKTKTIGELDPAVNLKTLVKWDLDFIPDDTPNREEAIAASADSMANAKIDPLAFLYLPADVVDPSVRGKLWDYTVQETTNLISFKGDFDKEWDKFVEGWLKLGQKYWDETDKQAKAENRS